MAQFDQLAGRISRVFWPELNTLNRLRQGSGTADVVSFLYASPLAVAGLVWLVLITSASQMASQLPFLILNFLLIYVFSQVSYFIVVEIPPDRFGTSESSFSGVILWSTLFLLGPVAIWMMVLWIVVNAIRTWRQTRSRANHWSIARNAALDLAGSTLGVLVALEFYHLLGGQIPLASLDSPDLARALLALLIHFLAVFAIWSGYILFHLRLERQLEPTRSIRPILKLILLGFGLPYLALPFSLLIAGLYVQNGLAIYLFVVVGLLMVAVVARQLSMSVENARQQSRQLEKLEKLGRALIDAPPDGSQLAQLLQESVADMFPASRVAIRLFPDQSLVNHPEDAAEFPTEAWEWLSGQNEPSAFRADDALAWDHQESEHSSIVACPILKQDTRAAIGAILVELRTLARPWDHPSLRSIFPAVLALSDQISSALHQAEVHERFLKYSHISQELSIAGAIQASFLPNKFPTIPGWQLAVTLLPARETSGDFFDVIELEDGRLAILVADVADKGVGAALYMALARTLIRTYALEYDAEPEVVFYAANRRLLGDARANLFVTAFFGILDPAAGTITYCNAGHNPPFLLRAGQEGAVEMLARTGMAIGIEEDATWTQTEVNIQAGDVVILYTDGLPDSQNKEGQFLGEEKILESVQGRAGASAYDIQSAILEEMEAFQGDAPQFDDITLMILLRD